MPPKDKGKARQQKATINFALPVQSLAQSNPDPQSWWEEGLAQEGQGERYQSGAKALRHYSNASTSYQVAATLRPSFQHLYNWARVDLIRAEEASAPACTELANQSIRAFRQAIAIESASTSTGGSTADVVDGTYNLASALVTLGDMIESGARDGMQEIGDAAALYWEAQELFQKVEDLQLKELNKEGLTKPRTSRGSSMSDDEGAAAGGGIEVQATESYTVVPPVVLDTILERVSTEIRIYSLALGSTAEDIGKRASLVADLSIALDRIGAVRRLIPANQDNAEQDLRSEMAYLDIVTTCAASINSASVYSKSAADVTAIYRRLIQANSKDMDLLSQFADHLVNVVDKGAAAPAGGVQTVLQEALLTYQLVHTTLSDRLKRPSSVPAHTIPSLLCANLVSQSTVNLALYHYQLSSSAGRVTADLDTALATAQATALAAINASNAGVRVTTSDGIILTSVPMARTDPVESALDWRTAKAFREAFLTLIRIQMRMGVDGPDLGLFQRLTGREGRSDVARFAEEIKEDFVWNITGGVEQSRWQALAEF